MESEEEWTWGRAVRKELEEEMGTKKGGKGTKWLV